MTYPRHIRKRILRKSKDITAKIIREEQFSSSKLTKNFKRSTS